MKKCIITVLGKDTVGIIAKVCTYLADNKINILDISQTIVQGYFNMMMIVDMDKSEKGFGEVFKERGYSMDPPKITNVKQYLELHIEQGKVLEEYGMSVGIVTDIAGPRRFNVHIHGEAEHSGEKQKDAGDEKAFEFHWRTPFICRRSWKSSGR